MTGTIGVIVGVIALVLLCGEVYRSVTHRHELPVLSEREAEDVLRTAKGEVKATPQRPPL